MRRVIAAVLLVLCVGAQALVGGGLPTIDPFGMFVGRSVLPEGAPIVVRMPAMEGYVQGATRARRVRMSLDGRAVLEREIEVPAWERWREWRDDMVVLGEHTYQNPVIDVRMEVLEGEERLAEVRFNRGMTTENLSRLLMPADDIDLARALEGAVFVVSEHRSRRGVVSYEFFIEQSHDARGLDADVCLGVRCELWSGPTKVWSGPLWNVRWWKDLRLFAGPGIAGLPTVLSPLRLGAAEVLPPEISAEGGLRVRLLADPMVVLRDPLARRFVPGDLEAAVELRR